MEKENPTKGNITLADSGVVFDQSQHRYFLGGKELSGVTSTLIKRAFPSTYDNIPQAVLDAAAQRGSVVHASIEMFNGVFDGDDSMFPADDWTPELRSYVGMVKTNGLRCLASEYIVTDFKDYASAIDGVYADSDGGIVLVDYKTTSQLYYESVALQLSIYARFFEMVNRGLKVKSIACMWLRGDKGRYVELGRVSDGVLDDLIRADLNEDLSYSYTPEIPAGFYALEQEFVELSRKIGGLQERQTAVKDKILALMRQNNAKSYKTAADSFTYVPPTTGKKFDSAKLKEDDPDLYDKYTKESTIAASLRIKLKK